jgi:WbqC-like protein family
MKIAIMQPGYLPWLGFFELMAGSDLFVFLDDVQYTVRDWRNRNRIRTKNDWQWLTVPVLHKHRKSQLIKDVMINNTIGWSKKHRNALEINYHKAKFFCQYYPALDKIYSEKWTNLCDMNIAFTIGLARQLGINVPVMRSSGLNVPLGRMQKILAICKALQATELYDSQKSEQLWDWSKFTQENIKVTFQHYAHPVYKQTYEPFIPYMSVVDLLFNHGPDSLKIIINAGK